LILYQVVLILLPVVTKTLFHVPTTSTARGTSESDNSSDDSCCGNLDAKVGQSKSVLESMLIGEEVPIEEGSCEMHPQSSRNCLQRS
jgi:hypothetical protein